MKLMMLLTKLRRNEKKMIILHNYLYIKYMLVVLIDLLRIIKIVKSNLSLFGREFP